MKVAIRPQRAMDLRIRISSATLRGDLVIPPDAAGTVLFAHGSGSSRRSSRNRFVATMLQEHGVGTLLFDLLTEDEERIDAETAHLRFDIPLLSERLISVTDWFWDLEGECALGYFGASTGAAAALIAAAHFGDDISAVVSRGGRPDLAGKYLPNVTAPTLLIIGALDEQVIGLNQKAFAQLRCEKDMQIVPGATHLFEEPGRLEMAAQLATRWFADKLPRAQ